LPIASLDVTAFATVPIVPCAAQMRSSSPFCAHNDHQHLLFTDRFPTPGVRLKSRNAGSRFHLASLFELDLQHTETQSNTTDTEKENTCV
jgi:hypothetical protein